MKRALYFGAVWCGPCRTFKPIMQEVAQSGYSVQFFDVDQNQQTATSYGVSTVPTVVIVDGQGIEVDRLIGVHMKQQVIDRMK